MKVFKYIFLIAFLFFGSIITVSANSDYYFDQYDIDMNVSENNIISIKGDISAYYNVPKHGFYINLPLYNNVKREDGSSYQKRAKIFDIKVDNQFVVSNDNNNRIIKIGDPDLTVTGLNRYIFSYKYELGSDGTNKYDELYFNIIGTERDTNINNINFKITMPKAFDANKLGFSTGSYGSTGYADELQYQVSGNVISGSYNKPLAAYEGITVRLELDEGYFVIKPFPSWWGYITIILCLLFIGYAYTLWDRYGRDEEVVSPINFYPPDGLNSAEVGYAYKGRAQNNQIVSLIIYLADQGYLTIHEDKKNYRFVKVKEYDGNDEIAKAFFDELFLARQEVTKNDLEESFYLTNEMLIRKLILKMSYIYEKSNLKAYGSIIIMILLTALAVGIVPMATGGGADLVSTFAYLPFIYTINIGIGIITILILMVLIYLLSKRSPAGQQLLNNISGFKKFLKNAEQKRLELLIKDNPQYFYNIIPYAYVLGVSSIWIKKFESIVVEPPTWYVSPYPFAINNFNSFISNTIASTADAMTSVPASKNSGFSGGGFSGGGAGGGGMGSW